MQKFLVFRGGTPAGNWPLRNIHVLDAYGNSVSFEHTFENGQIAIKRTDGEHGPIALAIQHPVGQLGEITLQTTLLPEREEPYVLVLELARHRLMTLYNRLEEWSMFDLPEDHAAPIRTNAAREAFVDALSLQADNPSEAQKKAQVALVNAVDGTEELVLAHAELLINRRRETKCMPPAPMACGISLLRHEPQVLNGLHATFDAVRVPAPWRHLQPEEPKEGQAVRYNWSLLDPWMTWGRKNGVRLTVGPILAFDAINTPEWLYVWEHDFETIRDMAYDHAKALVTRYGSAAHTWVIASGIESTTQFGFSPEQTMDLLRTVALVVRKKSPKSKIMIELREPWGEYAGKREQAVSPKPFVDMLSQLSVPFDSLGLMMPMGQALPGQYVRDLLQIANVVDLFGHLGKPLHVHTGVPSGQVTRDMIQQSGLEDDQCGAWRMPWNEQVQGHWLEAVMHICLSRPYVESVTWMDIIDHAEMSLPLAGLLQDDLKAKRAFKRILHFRQTMIPPKQAGKDKKAVKNIGAASA